MANNIEKSPVKLILLGGFLGAGKTTFMMRLAEILTARGRTTALITNDQGEQLVDSSFARASGFEVGEVTGSCFCCNFPEFISNIDSIIRKVNPDFIIAEPVGSCTDLISTIITPLEKFHSRRVELNSFLVLADGLRFSEKESNPAFLEPLKPGEILIEHQLKEASIILLNKCDLLGNSQKLQAVDRLAELNPDAEIFPVSAADGTGLEKILTLIEEGNFNTEKLTSVDIDYHIYAAAEAEYGWYNGSWDYKMPSPKDPAELGMSIMQSFFDPTLNDVAHAKLHLVTEKGSMKISFVAGRIQADTSTTLLPPAETISILLNIRATIQPEGIVRHVQKLQRNLAEEFKGTNTGYSYDALIPGAPDPTYRL